MNTLKTAVLATTILASLTALTLMASASQKSKNDWRNLGIGAAAVGIYGATRGDKTTTAVGLGGAAYSAYRYEQDRKHQSQEQSARNSRRYHQARSSSRKYYTYNGHSYYLNTRTGARVRVN